MLGGFTVWFPTFTLTVDDKEDSYLSYQLLGKKGCAVDYMQPKT